MTKLRLISIIMMLGLVFSLSCCGKVSSPVPLEGSGYPHSYPRR